MPKKWIALIFQVMKEGIYERVPDQLGTPDRMEEVINQKRCLQQINYLVLSESRVSLLRLYIVFRITLVDPPRGLGIWYNYCLNWLVQAYWERIFKFKTHQLSSSLRSDSDGVSTTA